MMMNIEYIVKLVINSVLKSGTHANNNRKRQQSKNDFKQSRIYKYAFLLYYL